MLHYLLPNWMWKLLYYFNNSKTDKARIKAAEAWIKHAEEIAKKTQHYHAKELCRFMRKHTFPASPTNSGFKVIRRSEVMDIPFVVLIADDQNLSGLWKSQYDMADGMYALFMTDKSENFGVICLRDHTQATDMVKGILCLHETKHAWHYLQRCASGQQGCRTEFDRDKEEVEILEFECTLLEKLLGSEYSEFIESEVVKFIGLGAIRGNRISIDERWFRETLEYFFLHFLKPVNAYETSFFNTVLQYHVTFSLIDKHWSQDILSAKISFIRQVRMRSKA